MIIVSGATGFLGAHVVCYILQQGKSVKALKRAGSSLDEFNYIFSSYTVHLTSMEKEKWQSQLTWAEADVLDIPALDIALEGATEIYHCAAVVSFLQKHRNKMMDVNVTGTANMVNMALAKGVKKFCHVSSIAALGREKSGVHITEDSKWVNSTFNSNYAISKYKAEMEVWRAMEEGLNAVIVNPGVILGIGNWHKGSCALFALPWKNFPFYTTGINGYVDVQDVARAMFQLMQTPESFHQRYILIGDNMNMQNFMHTVADNYSKAHARYQVKPWMAEVAWRLAALQSFFTGKEANITKETARASINTYFYSSKKITDAIGFKFTPMAQTLLQISNQFKSDHTT